jgi:hypothetical protein
MVERELDTLEETLNIDLGREQETELEKDPDYYPQFDEAIRKEAAEMGSHYELFYCLENSIRKLISDRLEAEHGSNWWSTNAVPKAVKDNVQDNMQKELDMGVTPRSTESIDYTTFGELGQIVRGNWDTFSDTFNSQKAFGRIMASLNILRGPIAHCSPLAADEELRLRLAIRDWFRLME